MAFHLGKADRRSAAAVFRRTLCLAVAAGVAILGLLLAGRDSLPGVFTKDPAVVHQVATVRPASAFAACCMHAIQLSGSNDCGGAIPPAWCCCRPPARSHLWLAGQRNRCHLASSARVLLP